MSEDLEAQDNELVALESIFSDSFHSFHQKKQEDATDDYDSEKLLKGGELKICIELPQPFYLTFINSKHSSKCKIFGV